MAVYVALLRGINVGKARRIAMADLRALMVELGYTQPESLLSSGNLVFDSTQAASTAALARTMAAGISARMDLTVPVIVLAAEELDVVVQDNPYSAAADPSRLLVAFTQEVTHLDTLCELLVPVVRPPDSFHRGQRAAYLHCPNGLLDSPAGERLLAPSIKALVTTRNWATTLKLHALASRREAQGRPM